MQRFPRSRDYDDEAPAGDGLSLVAAETPGRAQRRVERMLSARLREVLKDTERLQRRLAEVEDRLAEVGDRLAGAWWWPAWSTPGTRRGTWRSTSARSTTSRIRQPW